MQYSLNTRILQRTGTSPFVLMFGREPNGKMHFNSTKLITDEDIKRIKDHWEHMNNLVYPATRERVELAQKDKVQTFNTTHPIRSYEPVGL